MTLNEIAAELVAGCRENRAHDNIRKLYAPDAVSVEAAEFSGMGREAKGVDAILAKGEWWESTFDVIGGDISDPMPHGDDRFAVIFEVKTKHKESGEIAEMKEVALYTIDDGKIVREEFFYGA